MDATVGTLLGVVVGALIGGGGKYFGGRRDAWSTARAHGLMLLADVKAASTAPSPDFALALASWTSHREELARFRRGLYPSGFRAGEWSALAACFAAIGADPADTAGGLRQLAEAERQLTQFENDPHVFWYVVSAPFR